MANWFMKEPCQHCPFRSDVRPFLHPERAEELAYMTENRYNEFHCHQTIDYEDDSDGELTDTSLICAGFLSMQCNYSREPPEGFEPSELVYSEASDMAYAYEDEWNSQRRRG